MTAEKIRNRETLAGIPYLDGTVGRLTIINAYGGAAVKSRKGAKP